jgi:golgi apparatus protein 1
LNEELKLSQLQAQDVRLRPRLMKLCGEEMVVFCKGIKPGSGKIFNCLLENVQKQSFSKVCKGEVLTREDRLKSDWRLDPGVSRECKKDVDTHCAVQKARAHGNAEVLWCLAEKMMDPAIKIADRCENQMSRYVLCHTHECGSCLLLVMRIII